MYQIDQIEVTWHKAASTHDVDLMMTIWAAKRHAPDRHANLFREDQIRTFWAQSEPFQTQNDWIDETPSYKAVITVNGNTGSLYFECHFVDIPTHKLITSCHPGGRRKINNRWLITSSIVVNAHPEPVICQQLLSLADNPLACRCSRARYGQPQASRRLVGSFLLVTLGSDPAYFSDANDRVETLGKLQQRTVPYQNLHTDAVLGQLIALRVARFRQDLPGGEHVTGGQLPLTIILREYHDRSASTSAQLGFVPPTAERNLLSQIDAMSQFLQRDHGDHR